MENQAVEVKLTAATQKCVALQCLAETLEARVMMLESATGKASAQEVAQVLAAFPPLPAGTDVSVKIAEVNKKSIALKSLAEKLEGRINSMELSVFSPPGGLPNAISTTPDSQNSFCRAFIQKVARCCSAEEVARRGQMPSVNVEEALQRERTQADATLLQHKEAHAIQITQHVAEISQLRDELNKERELRHVGCSAEEVARQGEMPSVNLEEVLQRERVQAEATLLQHKEAHAIQISQHLAEISQLRDELSKVSTKQVQEQESWHAERVRDCELQLQQSSERHALQQQNIADLQGKLAAQEADTQQHAMKAEAAQRELLIHQQRALETEEGYKGLSKDYTALRDELNRVSTKQVQEEEFRHAGYIERMRDYELQLQQSSERDAFQQQTIADLQTKLAAQEADAQQHAVKAEAVQYELLVHQQRERETTERYVELSNDHIILQQRLQQQQDNSKDIKVLQAKITELQAQQALATVSAAAPEPLEPAALSSQATLLGSSSGVNLTDAASSVKVSEVVSRDSVSTLTASASHGKMPLAVSPVMVSESPRNRSPALGARSRTRVTEVASPTAMFTSARTSARSESPPLTGSVSYAMVREMVSPVMVSEVLSPASQTQRSSSGRRATDVSSLMKLSDVISSPQVPTVLLTQAQVTSPISISPQLSAVVSPTATAGVGTPLLSYTGALSGAGSIRVPETPGAPVAARVAAPAAVSRMQAVPTAAVSRGQAVSPAAVSRVQPPDVAASPNVSQSVQVSPSALSRSGSRLPGTDVPSFMKMPGMLSPTRVSPAVSPVASPIMVRREGNRSPVLVTRSPPYPGPSRNSTGKSMLLSPPHPSNVNGAGTPLAYQAYRSAAASPVPAMPTTGHAYQHFEAYKYGSALPAESPSVLTVATALE